MSERSSRRFAQSVDIVLGERHIFVQEPLLRPSMTTEVLCSEAPCVMARTFTAAEPSAWRLRGDAVRTCHTVADFRQDAAAAVDLEALDLPLAQLRVDGAAHEPVGTIRLGGGARKTSHALYCP